MATIQFANGVKVNFNGTPTPEEVEQIAQRLGLRPPEPEPSKLGQFAGAVASPFIRAGVSARGVAKSTGNVLKGGVQKAFGADEAAQESFAQAGRDINEVQEGVKVGGLGTFKGVGTAPTTGNLGKDVARGAADIIGTGAEIGSFFAPAPKAFQGLKALKGGQILSATGKGIQSGALAGASGGFGRSLQEIGPDDTFLEAARDVLGATAKEGLLGGAIGGAIGGIGATASKAFKGAGKLKRGIGKTIQESDEHIAEVADTIQAVDDSVKSSRVGGISALDDSIPSSKKLVKNALAKNAEAKDLSFIARSKKGSISTYNKITNLLKENANKRNVKRRPVHVLGDVAFDDWQAVGNARKTVGAKLGDALDNIGSKEVRTDFLKADYLSDLRKFGIRVGEKGKLIFKDSAFKGKSSAGERKLLQEIFDDLSRSDLTAETFDAVIRKRLAKDLALHKTSGTASKEVLSILGKVRSSAGEVLDDLSPAYAKARRQFAPIAQLDEALDRWVGRKFSKLPEKDLRLRLGEILMRSKGNASAEAVAIRDLLEEMASKLSKNRGHDLSEIIEFVDITERIWGSTQTRALQGQVARAGVAAAEATLGGPAGIVKGAANAIDDAILSTNALRQEAITDFVEGLVRK